MTYPNNMDYFVTKIDKNASGWYISGENFNIPSSSPYTMYFDHVPKDTSTTHIYASGYRQDEWTEITSGSPLASGEFLVDYDTGLVQFYSGNSGRSVEAVYVTLGDDIMAEHVNSLQIAASGIEKELGLGLKAGYTDLAARLNDLNNTVVVSADQVTCISPGTTTFTDVQGHIDAGRGAYATDANPHGIGWSTLFDTAGDIDDVSHNIVINNVAATSVTASGTFMGINWQGPDRDSYLYFYNGASATGEWVKWDDGDDRFEVSDELYVHGPVTASGALTLVENSDTLTITGDGTDWWIKPSDGSITIQTDEGTNTRTDVNIRGKGTGSAMFTLYDGSSVNYWMSLDQTDTIAGIDFGTSVTEFDINDAQRTVDTIIKTKNSSTAFVINSDATATNEYVSSTLPTFMVGEAVPRRRAGGTSSIELSGTSLPAIVDTCWNATAAYAPIIEFNRSKGASIGTHAVVANNDVLGYISWAGSDGVEFIQAAQIRGEVDGTLTGGGTDDMPGRITFWTSPDGTATPVERMRIDNAGGIEWTAGNTWYVPIGGDINTYITNATSGDTLQLAAGTYTIVSGITVSKKIHLRGMGVGITTITCSTANVDMITANASGILITDMTISNTSTSNTDTSKSMIAVSAPCSVRNVSFVNSASGANNKAYMSVYNNSASNINFENCNFTSNGVIGYHPAYATVTNGATATLKNCLSSGSNGSSGTLGNLSLLLNGDSTSIVNMYNCNFVDPTSATTGIVRANGGSLNSYNCAFNGSGVGAFDLVNTAGTITLYNTTLVNNTTSGTISYVNGNSIAKSGNIYYSYVGEDLDALIASSKITAGDTIQLGAGTYTITSGITIAKKVHLRGMGRGITTIYATGASADFTMINNTADGSIISDMTLSNNGAVTGTTTAAIKAMILPTENTNIRNIEFLNAATGASYYPGVKIYYAKTVNIENCTHTATGAISWHPFVAGKISGATVNIRNSNATEANATFVGYGNNIIEMETGASTFNIYNCTFSSSTNLAGGVIHQHIAGGNINIYNSTINGSGAIGFDVKQDAGTLTLYNTTLVNNTTSGTITYEGTVTASKVQLASGTSAAIPFCTVGVSTPSGKDATVGFSRDATKRYLMGCSNTDDKFYLGYIGATAPNTTNVNTVLGIDISNAGEVQGNPYSTQKQHDEIGILLDCLTAPKAIVGFTGTGATTTTESGYESGAGRVWTYSGGLAADKIFQGSTYVYSFDGTDSYLSTPDTDDMSFGDSSNDSAFSIGGWIQVVLDTANKSIITKWDTTTGSELREYILQCKSDETLVLSQYDESVNKIVTRTTNSALSAGWHFIVVTQSGTGGATAMDTATIYVDGVVVASTAANDASYVAMENSTVTPRIGCYKGASADTDFFTGDMGRLFVTAEALSAATIWKIYEKTRGFYNR